MDLPRSAVKQEFPLASLFSSTALMEDEVVEEEETLTHAADPVSKRRTKKKKAFDALVLWCAAHQQAAMVDTLCLKEDATNTLTTSVSSSPPVESDEAVLQWLHESSDCLSCGQSLLVCSFLCEVFLCRLDTITTTSISTTAGSPSPTKPDSWADVLLQTQVNMFTNRIVSLLQRANASDKLESQPLPILMSCIYGVHRLACHPSQFLGETEKTLLKIPAAVMFAIVYQLRGDALDKLFQLEEQVAMNVCLTFLLIADEERRQRFFSGGDAVIVNTVLRRLVKHISSLTKRANETNKEVISPSAKGEAEEIALKDFSPVLCGSRGGVVNGSPTVQESVAIMQNITFSSPSNRMEVLSYLLRTQRKPAHYTRDELQMIPAMLQTVSNVHSAEAQNFRNTIIAEVPIPHDNPVLAAHLLSFSAFNKSRFLPHLNVVKKERLSKSDALHIIRWVGQHLQWETLEQLIEIALDNEATRTATTSAVSTTKVVLNNGIECIMEILLTRLQDVAVSSERSATQTHLAQLFDKIDWVGTPPPEKAKSALARLELLKKLSNCGFTVHAPDVVVVLIEKSLDLESGGSIASTLKRVSEVLPLLSDLEKRQSVTESMIRYNGTRSSSSLIRFVAFLAPIAVKNRVCNNELVQSLLKIQTLNPYKLRQGFIEGLSREDDSFTLFIINGINYLLASAEWRTSTDNIRSMITLWIQEYLHYLMNLSQKQKLAKESVQSEDRKEMSLSTEGGAEATGPRGPSQEQLEEVFSCMLRAGVKLPEFFASELNARVGSIEREGREKDDVGDEQAGGDEKNERRKPRFPPASHFVFCCKLDIALDSPFTMELLKHLLTTCDCRILHSVLAVFLVNARDVTQETHLSLLTNVRLVCQSLELFLYRVDQLRGDKSGEFYPSSLSSVVANTLRFLVSFLTKQERNQRVMLSIRSPHLIEEKEEKIIPNKDELLLELARVEELFLRTFAYLSSAHMKDISLLFIDRFTLLAPSGAHYLMLHLEKELENFTQVELFYLVRKYPHAQDVVLRELKKYDIALSVDLNDYVRVAKDLPMVINDIVIKAHLPTLSFQWCTRVLSAISLKHETMPMNLLTCILLRLEEEVSNATVMDRNVALVVLQKYLHFDDVVMNNKELSHRRHRVEQCCDRLLVLEEIGTLESLSGFLSSFPDALSSVVGKAITEHVVKVILPSLLVDLDGLLVLCRLLQKHKLLNNTVKLVITDEFFEKILRVENSEDTSSSSCLSSSAAAPASPSVYPLGNVLAFTLLLSEGDSSQRLNESEKHTSRINVRFSDDNPPSIPHRVLHAVKERYSSLSDHLMILTTIIEQKDAARFMETQAIVIEEVCSELIKKCDKMTSSEFSKLLQCISRLKYWHLVKDNDIHFGNNFKRIYREADAHSRCVAFKALSLDADLFSHYDSFMIPLLGDVVDVMSQEDMEMVLSSVLHLKFTESLESLLDAIGTRVLSMVDQCRRSTLIRMLQCHATFSLEDDTLVLRLLSALEEQCNRETRLDTSQALTLLQSVVDLDVPMPPRLAITCFAWLEHHIDDMTTSQLGHATRLAVEVEMGYTASVHALAMRALEQREAIRTNATFRESVELLCDEFSVEIPCHLKPNVLRRRYQEERLNEYINKQRSAAVSQ